MDYDSELSSDEEDGDEEIRAAEAILLGSGSNTPVNPPVGCTSFSPVAAKGLQLASAKMACPSLKRTAACSFSGEVFGIEELEKDSKMLRALAEKQK